MWAEIKDTLNERFRAAPVVAAKIEDLERQVANGTLAPATGAQKLLAAFLGDNRL
jgi:LAO/AO transport system kinase